MSETRTEWYVTKQVLFLICTVKKVQHLFGIRVSINNIYFFDTYLVRDEKNINHAYRVEYYYGRARVSVIFKTCLP